MTDSVLLGDVAAIRYGKGLTAANRIVTGRVPVFGSAGIVGVHDTALVTSEVIIIGRKGNAGRVFSSAVPCWPIDTVYFLEVPPQFDRRFLELYLAHKHLGTLDSSTAVPSLRSADLAAVEIPMIPIGEQRRLVAIIEKHFSHLDATESALRSNLLRLARLKSAAFAAVNQCDAPVFRLSEVASIVSGNTPKGLEAAERGDVPFFKVGDMNFSDGHEMAEARQYLSSAAVASMSIKVRPPGTVLFPKRGGAIATNKKRLLRSQGAFDLNTMGIIPGKTLESWFLLYWLETIDLARLSDGSNVPQINHGDLAPLLIPVPPLDVQRKLVERIRYAIEGIEKMTLECNRILRMMDGLRTSILRYAFSTSPKGTE